MPVFAYRAADRMGRTIDGVMEAYDPQGVVERLHRDDYFPLRIEPAEAGGWLDALRQLLRAPARIPARTILTFTQQLSALLDAGLPLERALGILGELTENPDLRPAALRGRLRRPGPGLALADPHPPRGEPRSRHLLVGPRPGRSRPRPGLAAGDPLRVRAPLRGPRPPSTPHGRGPPQADRDGPADPHAGDAPLRRCPPPRGPRRRAGG